MEKVQAGGQSPYPIYIGEGILKETSAILKESLRKKMHGDSRVLIVTDKNVSRYHLKPLMSDLKKHGFLVSKSIEKSGERLKNPNSLNHLLHTMVNRGMTRDSTLVALGGGVIGDFAGFAASIYMRGCHLLQIPTTLLAQVDASVGGKVGINLREGKNLVGNFYNPLAVISDTGTLKSLPPREFIAGFAEIIKYGLIFRKKLFQKVERFFTSSFPQALIPAPANEIKSRALAHMDFLTNIILESVKIKAEIVASDERENDLRMILNFGHTFGHAVENLTGYRRFLHGEAVLLGIKMASRLSAALEMIEAAQQRRIDSLLSSFPIPSTKNLSAKKLYAQMGRDKKRRSGSLHYIILKEIGYALSQTDVKKRPVVNCISQVLAEHKKISSHPPIPEDQGPVDILRDQGL